MTGLPSTFEDIEIIIMDMDGVITSEQAYWDTAGLVIQDILESPAYLGLNPSVFSPVLDIFYKRLVKGSRSDWRKYLPPEIITHFKLKGINSNWDLTYIVLSLYLAFLYRTPFNALHQHVFQSEKNVSFSSNDIPLDVTAEIKLLQSTLEPAWNEVLQLVKEQRWNEILRMDHLHLWGDYFRQKNVQVSPVSHVDLRIMDDFHPDVRGLTLIHEINKLVDHKHRLHITPFCRDGILWNDCRLLFQSWYLGGTLYQSSYETQIAYNQKPGLIHGEKPLHDIAQTHTCLSQLKEAGYILGISTGRPRREIITPLEEWDMLHYFDEERISTYDEVESAEFQIRLNGLSKKLGKPHPYIFTRSVFPEKDTHELAQIESLIPDANKVLIIGDAQADLWAAETMGCCSAGVLSGAIGPSARAQLEEANPDVIFNNVLELSGALVQIKHHKEKMIHE